MQNDEHELIAQSLAKDADAYGQIVERYKDALYRHCFAIVRDEDAAEDIAQEAFIAAYYKLDSFDQSRKFSRWILKIATNKSLNYIKSRRHLVATEDEVMDRVVSGGTSPEDAAVASELHGAISRLDPKYRSIINLYYFEGMDYEEISRIMNRPIGSIKGWMNRAKSELRKELA